MHSYSAFKQTLISAEMAKDCLPNFVLCFFLIFLLDLLFFTRHGCRILFWIDCTNHPLSIGWRFEVHSRVLRQVQFIFGMWDGNVLIKSDRWVSSGYSGFLRHDDHTNAKIGDNEHDKFKLYNLVHNPCKKIKFKNWELYNINHNCSSQCRSPLNTLILTYQLLIKI